MCLTYLFVLLWLSCRNQAWLVIGVFIIFVDVAFSVKKSFKRDFFFSWCYRQLWCFYKPQTANNANTGNLENDIWFEQCSWHHSCSHLWWHLQRLICRHRSHLNNSISNKTWGSRDFCFQPADLVYFVLSQLLVSPCHFLHCGKCCFLAHLSPLFSSCFDDENFLSLIRNYA